MRIFFVASTYRRIFAFIFDSFISQIFWIPVTIQIIGSWLKSQEIQFDFRWVILSFALSFGYRVLFNYFLGGTVGKLLFGLRLVNKNDPEKGLGLLQAVIRVLAEQLSLFFSLAPQSLMFLRFDRTHVADWVAETRVVQLFERNAPPKRRPVVAILFFVYFLITGFSAAYNLVRTSSIEKGQVLLMVPKNTINLRN